MTVLHGINETVNEKVTEGKTGIRPGVLLLVRAYWALQPLPDYLCAVDGHRQPGKQRHHTRSPDGAVVQGDEQARARRSHNAGERVADVHPCGGQSSAPNQGGDSGK